MITVRPLAPGDAGWVLERHAVHYARVEGFDRTFEATVAAVLADFLRDADPATDRGWIARAGGRRAGSIFAMRLDAHRLQLRLFYVEPARRRQGVGQALLDALLGHAAACGFAAVRLWTHAEHRAACRLYARNGFVRLSSRPVRSFGRDLTEETWEKPLASA